jgi:type I restriction enzyme S subunit
MNATQLLAHFDRLAEAADAVARLRRFILDLAIRGKLVEQDPNDEPAAEQLKRIREEKAGLITKGELKNREPRIRSIVGEGAINPRPGWAAVQLNEIVLSLQTGPFGSSLHQNDYVKGGIPVINPACIKNGQITRIDSMAVGPNTLDRLASFKVKKGDVVLARRGEMGRCALVTPAEDGWLCGTGCIILRLPVQVYGRFIVSLIGSPTIREHLAGSAIGVIMQSLNQAVLMSIPIALPPLAEQHRIVAKVNELMGVCDRLEAAQAERERRRDRLAAASLERLNPPDDDAKAFRAHASFHLRHLPRLTARPAQIPALRRTILNLAVRGKLVPQDPNDEPASEFVKRIQLKKSQFTKQENTKPLPALPHVEGCDAPFAVPFNWQWVRFGDVIAEADSGWSPKTESFPRTGDNWGVLKVSAVSWDKFRPDENKQLLPRTQPPTTIQVHSGDFLISRANTSELVAKCVVVEKEPKNLILSDKIVRLRIVHNCCKEFLWMVNNNAQYARAYYADQASGTSLSMKNVSRAVIYLLPIPLPPLAEQHRIVAKVAELMAVCDRLESQLTTAQTESRRLLEAVLHDALASGGKFERLAG